MAAPAAGAGGRWMLTRAKRIVLWGMFSAVTMVATGVLLADHFTPPATGEKSTHLEITPGQTALDRELEPILARHPGQTGALMVSDGLDAFAARAMSARQAGRSLDLMYYIWHDDLAGHMLAREAYMAAERGVRVRLLLDDINATGKDTALLTLDSHPNVEVRLYNPFRNREGIARLLEMVQRLFNMNHRMHNKAWIADNRVAVVGGRNIGVEYFSASTDSNFHDLDMLLFGPGVEQASDIFDAFWNSDQVVPLDALNEAAGNERDATVDAIAREAASPEARAFLDRVDGSPTVRGYLTQALKPYWTDDLAILSDPPDKSGDAPREALLVTRIESELRSAKAKALIVSPYFVPGDDGTAMLTGLAQAGVQTGIITNSLAANDVVAVHGGYSKYRGPLLEAGVRIYEIRAQSEDGKAGGSGSGSGGSGSGGSGAGGSGSGGSGPGGSKGSSSASLHTKAFVVDDRRGFVGSFNMDPRSESLNTEMGVFFDDPGLGRALRAEYLHLASPGLSDWVWLDRDGNARWLDRAGPEPVVLMDEPGATRWQKIQAVITRWLPIESQL